jgi:hypothetical protein
MAFFLQTNVMINFFHNLALFRVKNANFFAEFFGENILKIITSVPGHPVGKLTACMLTRSKVAKLKILAVINAAFCIPKIAAANVTGE